jgi:cytidine deaminase
VEKGISIGGIVFEVEGYRCRIEERPVVTVSTLINLAASRAVTGPIDRRFYVGAVAIRKDGAIVTARNELVEIPTYPGHAEARLMRKAGYGAIVFVARVLRNGDLALAKPCPRCQSVMRNHGVKKVYYTTYNEVESMRL